MPHAVEVSDRVGYHDLKNSEVKQANEEAARGETGLANRNLHRLEVLENPHGETDTGERRRVVAQYDEGYRPRADSPELGSVKFYREEQLPALEERIFEDRLEHSSSPFVNKRDLDPNEQRPEENVATDRDIWSFDPALEEDLGVDIGLLANDMASSHNPPKVDLDEPSQDGIETVKGRKSELITDRQELQKEAAKILQRLDSFYQPTGQPALQSMRPLELVEFVEDEVAAYFEKYQVQDQQAQMLHQETQDLRLFAEDVVGLHEETESVSQQTFREMLGNPGFERPSGVGVEDTVDDYGVGSSDYLWGADL